MRHAETDALISQPTWVHSQQALHPRARILRETLVTSVAFAPYKYQPAHTVITYVVQLCPCVHCVALHSARSAWSIAAGVYLDIGLELRTASELLVIPVTVQQVPQLLYPHIHESLDAAAVLFEKI